MKLTCSCGREFDAPDGVQQAKCPKCGKTVAAAPGQDWLLNMDMDNLALDGRQEAKEAPGPTPTPPTQQAAPQAGPARAPAAGRAAGAASGVAPAKAVGQEPAAVAPTNLVGLIGLVKDRPKEALRFFRAGTVEPGLLIQLGVAVVGMSLVTAGLRAWLISPRAVHVGEALGFWLGMVCETVGSAAVLSLLCVLFKRNAHPVGVSKGVVTARLGALAATLVFALIMAAVSAATMSPQLPGSVLWVNRHVGHLYLLLVFCFQAPLAVGLLELGCAVVMILNFIAVYGAKTLAETLGGKF
jgi:hypothetical protein